MPGGRASHQGMPGPVLDEGAVEVCVLAIAGMGDFGVVGLDEVVDHHLPVGADLVVDVACLEQTCRLHTAGADIREDRSENFLGRRRRAIDVDEDKRVDFREPHRKEAERDPVEGLEMRRASGADKTPVEIVDPPVIGALQHIAPARLLDDLHGAVLTDIVEGAQFPLAIAHDDQRLAMNRPGQHGARFRHFAGVAHVDPRGVEDARSFRLEHRRIRVVAGSEDRRGQRIVADAMPGGHNGIRKRWRRQSRSPPEP